MRDGKSFQGVGAAGGRRLLFKLRGGVGRLAFSPVAFALFGTGVATRFAFAFITRLAFAFRLALPFALPFSFAFLLGVGFFFGLSFVFDELLLLLLAGSVFVFVFALVLEFAGGVLSPLPLARLMSTATVWPTLTISPACGS
jgi:hypothetical protein